MESYRNAFIKFDSPRSIFYPGQVITGSFEIELDGPLTFSVIYVKFFGEASVSWTEQESETVNNYKSFKTVEYGGRENYFKGSELLAGSYDSITNLSPGKYSYPFYYRIPGGIPSSFKGSRGSVQYYVSGHVEFQTNPQISETKRNFEIVAPRDLNCGDACLREPIELVCDEITSCGCFGSSPASIRVRVPFSAYCPGQDIPIAVAVDNTTNVEISGMIFELLTRERYCSRQPVAEYIQPGKVLGTEKRGAIMSGNQRNFEVRLRVPEFIAPNLEDCKIIDVGYFIRVTIKVSGCNEDQQDEAEICLGLVPLSESVEGTYSHPMSHSLPVDPIPNMESIPDRPVADSVSQRGDPHQIGFITPETGRSASNLNYVPGGAGAFPNPYGIPMKCFTPPGVYPHPGQTVAPSAPPM